MNEENERVRREEDPEVYKREVKAITEDEVVLALNKMKNGKAVGPDNIPVEVGNALVLMESPTLLNFNNILQKEEMLKEWRRSVLVPIYKNKGDIMECGSFRGIKLMSHTMKTWERIVDHRIRSEVVISQGTVWVHEGQKHRGCHICIEAVAKEIQGRSEENSLHIHRPGKSLR